MNINRQRPEEARPKSNSSDAITWPTRGDVWSQDVRIYPKTLRSPPKRRVGYLGHGTGTRMRPTSLPGRWWVSFHLIPATRFVLRLLERQAGYLICFRTRTVMCCCLSQSKCFRMRSSTGQIQHDKPKGGPICWTCNKLTQAPIVSNCHSAESQSLAETMCSAKSATYEQNGVGFHWTSGSSKFNTNCRIAEWKSWLVSSVFPTVLYKFWVTLWSDWSKHDESTRTFGDIPQQTNGFATRSAHCDE